MTLNAHLAASYGCYLFKWKDLYLHFARLGHATILGKDVETKISLIPTLWMIFFAFTKPESKIYAIIDCDTGFPQNPLL